MKDMNEKELIRSLGNAFGALRLIDKSADKSHINRVEQQIVKIIQDSDLSAWMDKCHELKLEVARLRQPDKVED